MTNGLLVLCLAPSAAQAQSSAPPRTGYDKSWYISESWPGEYPVGFSITRKDTTVMARSAMDKKLPRTVACRLPYLAVLHLWNEARNRKNHVRYFSATKIIDLIAKENFEYDFYSDKGSRKVRLAIKKDNVIQYLQDLGEGAFIARINGKRYMADEDLFERVQHLGPDRFDTDLWVSLTCVNGARAYIYGPGLEKVPGVNVGPGETIYGKSRDLTVREAEQLEKDRSAR